MSNIFTRLLSGLSVLLVLQVGKSYAAWNFFDRQIYIPFLDYLWKFEKDCKVGCHYFSFKCFFPASAFSLCEDLHFLHECCEQFRITPTTSSTTTTTTTTTSTTTPSTTTPSTTTPSTTTSTEDPPMELCSPTPPPEMCQAEPGCSVSPHYPFWNKWLQQPGCEHKCWEHCFNPCACKTAANGNCEYHPSSGMCLARRTCDEMLFEETDCRRENSFYSIGGHLCHNLKSNRSNCENGTTIYAVNIAGEAHTDKRGIFYMADNEKFYEDEHSTRMEDKLAMSDGMVEVDQDKKLYASFAFGVANGMDRGQCLKYSVKVEEDGDYEITLRTLEPMYSSEGQRIFSLTLNQLPIVLHVDLGALSPADHFTPVDIIANFKIATIRESAMTRRLITLKGHPSMYYQSHVELGLCISDCRLCEEYSHFDPGYVGSGLSLVRFQTP